MKTKNRQIGREGEEAAAGYLGHEGYKIIKRNYFTKFGEIDIVCSDREITVFVEVKAKNGKLYGTPEEMFTRGKYNKVKRMAQLYLSGKEILCRIDMVAVELVAGELPQIRHYKNVVF